MFELFSEAGALINVDYTMYINNIQKYRAELYIPDGITKKDILLALKKQENSITPMVKGPQEGKEAIYWICWGTCTLTGASAAAGCTFATAGWGLAACIAAAELIMTGCCIQCEYSYGGEY